MKTHLSLMLLFLLLLPFGSRAQSYQKNGGGGIFSIDFSKALSNDFSISIEEELRFQDADFHLDRWLNAVGVDYAMLRGRLKVGVYGDYIRAYKNKGYYENRFRFSPVVSYSETLRRFKITYRSKWQATFFDESTGTHSLNPKWYWRNRIQASYQMPNSRYKYSLSTELHWLLNDPQCSCVDNIRTVVAVDYRLSRRYWLSLFARMDNEIQVSQPQNIFYLGAVCKIKY